MGKKTHGFCHMYNNFKVVCVKIYPSPFIGLNYQQLEIGKQFTVISQGVSSTKPNHKILYKLRSDDGEIVSWIESDYFVDLSEWRNKKLKEIGL